MDVTAVWRSDGSSRQLPRPSLFPTDGPLLQLGGANPGARVGQALTMAPIGPWDMPCARLALMVAAMPTPRLHLANAGTGWVRRVASRMAIEAAQIRPSTVNGTRRAVVPDSPCARTNS